MGPLRLAISFIIVLISTSKSFEVTKGSNCSCQSAEGCICCWHCVHGDCKDFKKESCKAQSEAGELAFCYREFVGKEFQIPITRVRYGCLENTAIPLTKSKRTQLVLIEYDSSNASRTLQAKTQTLCYDRDYCNEVADSSMPSAILKRTLPHIATALFAYILM